MELPNCGTHDLNVIEELGDVDLCPRDVDLHDDIQLCMQEHAITQGSQLDDVDIGDVGTFDFSCIDDSCCNEFGISYHMLGDDSEYLLDDSRFQDRDL